MNDHLVIELAEKISPPSSDHNLLVAFRFGAQPDDESHPAIVDTYLQPLGRETLYECWWIAEPVTYRNDGDIRIAECKDYAVLIKDVDETPGDDFENLTYQAYVELLSAVKSTDHLRLAKVWNYLGDINCGDGDLERYRRFSIGRAAAFADFGVTDDVSPTGTGIGTSRDHGLTIIALASKHPLQLVENPRQLSAFKYPRQYGPKSPKFARGGLVRNEKHDLCLLSGTAAIVGHESQHPFDVDLQLDETLRNLTALSETVPILDRTSALRVYLRNPKDLDYVSERLESALEHSGEQVVYLHGDICRRELVIEVDGARVC